MDHQFKEADKFCNQKPLRTWDDHPYPLKQTVEWELTMFMLWYNGKRPAWDFIQYATKNKLI